MFSHIKELFTTPSGYNIAKSVRLRSSASAYFNRTPASASNRKTYTFSCWAKRGSLSSNQNIVAQGNNEVLFRFNTTDNINFADYTGGSAVWEITSSSVYRDPSAWYHIVFAIDTTQATSSNRVKVWINNSQVTFTGTYPTLNSDTPFNTTNAMLIGNRTGVSQYYDGYLTEINFIDGQALTPSSFGETDSITGVWKAKKYGGTYGTNGFYLNFSDNSAATAAAIGKDYSGNGNNWTPNNISVTSGVTYDSMVDSPTVSAVSSNYCVMNTLDKNANVTISDGNLSFATSAVNYGARATVGVNSGKWYWEATVVAIGSTNVIIGVAQTGTGWDLTYVGSGSSSWGYISTGQKYNAGLGTAYGASFTTGDVIGVAFDADAGTLTFYKNNVSQGQAFSSVSGSTTIHPALSGQTSSSIAINFGQRPFTYIPPSGFVALNTNNLPVPTIKNGAAYMAATTYTGTGATASISNAVNGISFQPDFVWLKSRSNVTNHYLMDSVRGASQDLYTNSTAAEGASGNVLTAFNSNGFGLGTDAEINGSTRTYVGWQWKAGGSSSSNTNGSITSTVSVGATQGFSVVTYTGTGANATVGHGLGVAPSMIIVKRRDTTANWEVRHTSIAVANSIQLNLTNASASATTVWNSTAPSSTVFSIGTSATVNASSGTYVAYCFAAVAGFSAFGSYTGNGSADGPFVFTGFRPRFVMVKNITNSAGATNWTMQDSSRNGYNPNKTLYANASSAEDSSAYFDILSNGFKVRDTFRDVNTSGDTYVFACFSENPFKYALAR